MNKRLLIALLVSLSFISAVQARELVKVSETVSAVPGHTALPLHSIVSGGRLSGSVLRGATLILPNGHRINNATIANVVLNSDGFVLGGTVPTSLLSAVNSDGETLSVSASSSSSSSSAPRSASDSVVSPGSGTNQNFSGFQALVNKTYVDGAQPTVAEKNSSKTPSSAVPSERRVPPLGSSSSKTAGNQSDNAVSSKSSTAKTVDAGRMAAAQKTQAVVIDTPVAPATVEPVVVRQPEPVLAASTETHTVPVKMPPLPAAAISSALPVTASPSSPVFGVSMTDYPFPEGVLEAARPKDATVVGYGEQLVGQFYLTTPSTTVDQVHASLLDSAQRRGWTLVSTLRVGKISTLLFGKSSRALSIVLTPEPLGTVGLAYHLMPDEGKSFKLGEMSATKKALRLKLSKTRVQKSKNKQCL